MSFEEQIIVTLLDKALIGGLIAIAGFWLNRGIELYKSRRALENELEKLRDQKRIQFLESQLSNFFWPIYLRLQVDNVVWKRILERAAEDQKKRNIARQIENGFILVNHREIVKIIEGNIHLVGSDPALFKVLLDYMRHVAVYSAVRATGDLETDPLEVGEPWPRDLFPVLEAATLKKQQEWEGLLRSAIQAGAAISPSNHRPESPRRRWFTKAAKA
jgi:hypothetical protein